ncbi:unnamed protein product [Schistosoma rodhaini]|uniref:Chloride channel CLIC-like protein 1 n=1 Tax=Schistosoma mansoni TaxID=6183 RepID=A0A5K4F9K9_SCHMA|nr:unnamed protein product [Schistosoma rodhaini]
MFGGLPMDQEQSVSALRSMDSFSTPTNSSNFLAANHHQELHKILVRTLWRNINPRNLPNIPSKTPIKVQLEFVLQEKDIYILSKYCNLNNDSENRVSPDLINDIFSEIVRPVAISDNPYLFQWFTNTPSFWMLSLSCTIAFVWLLVIIFRSRYILFTLLPCGLCILIFCQSVYTKYNARLARKMSVLSRHNGPPDDCKPLRHQTWSQVLGNYFSSRPANDECAHYYEELLSEPFLSTSLYEICLELISQPVISLCKSLGIGIGQLYHNLSEYVPFWIAPFICVFCMFMGVFAFVKSIHRFTGPPSHNRRVRHKIKSSSTPSITS